MSLRQGITRAERVKMLAAIKEGADWKECVKLLTDVDLPFVKKEFFDRWAKKYGPKKERPIT